MNQIKENTSRMIAQAICRFF